MFDLGAKITLVASSHHKKTSPRKGSIGYVTTLCHFQTSIGNKDIFVTPSFVRFLHYGNEKKHRFEAKQVLLVFPVIRDNTEESLKSLIHIISADKYVNDWNKVRAAHSSMPVPEGTPIVIAAPIYTPEVSFKTCTNEELRCWFESCLLSHQISGFINKALVSHHPFKENIQCVTEQQLMMLRGMIISKQKRQAIINDMCEVESTRNKWIKLIRMVAIIAESKEQEDIHNNLYEVAGTGLFSRDGSGAVKHLEVYKILTPYIFRNKFEVFKNIFINRKGFSKIIKEMEATKKVIFALT